MDVVYVLFFEAGNYLFLTFWDVIFERGVDSVSGRRDDVKDDNDVYKVYKLKYVSSVLFCDLQYFSFQNFRSPLRNM